MFIENLSKEELTYRAHGKVLKLHSGLNVIKEVFFSPEELKRHFGSLINVYTNKATLVEEPRKAKEDEKTKDLASESDNKDTTECGDNTNKIDEKSENDEQSVEDNGEKEPMAPADMDNLPDEGAEQIQEETETATQEEEKEEGQKEPETEAQEKDGEEQLDIDSLKRPQLLALFKKLELEGNPASMKNDELKELIRNKLG